MSLIKYLFSFDYYSSNRNIIQIDEIDVKDSEQQQSDNTASINANTKRKIVVSINSVLAVVCLTSFFIICYNTIFYPDKIIPGFMQNIFMLTIGYYGSAFLTFFENN